MWDRNLPFYLGWVDALMSTVLYDFQRQGMKMTKVILVTKLSMLYQMYQTLYRMCRQLVRLYDIFSQGT